MSRRIPPNYAGMEKTWWFFCFAYCCGLQQARGTYTLSVPLVWHTVLQCHLDRNSPVEFHWPDWGSLAAFPCSCCLLLRERDIPGIPWLIVYSCKVKGCVKLEGEASTRTVNISHWPTLCPEFMSIMYFYSTCSIQRHSQLIGERKTRLKYCMKLQTIYLSHLSLTSPLSPSPPLPLSLSPPERWLIGPAQRWSQSSSSC